ncbi:hypothetical protein [Erysipelothrix piscisicarius]|uniref:hypothetical protein n=1 Tax=Erysipelothrix piscisicarius TaxID=2485784 RepID=UPI001E3089AB|nr:hypothetical protein [Erysipelothrix piscisicarius]
MYKFIVFNVREEERELTLDWAKRNNVEVTMAEGQLSMDNIHMVEGFDGLSTSQNTALEPEMYSILKDTELNKLHNVVQVLITMILI